MPRSSTWFSLRDTLAKVEAQLRETEEARHLSHAALTEQMKITRQSSDDLRAQTQALVTALRRPKPGAGGVKMQLRRVVELGLDGPAVRLRRAGQRPVRRGRVPP